MVSLAEIDLKESTKLSINYIQNAEIYSVEGDVGMFDNRKIGDIQGNKFEGNANFQGDNLVQTNTETTEVLNNALEELKNEIDLLTDTDEKEDADMQYDLLLKYIDENKPSRIKKCLTALKDFVGTTASFLVVCSQLGIAV